MTKNLPGPNKRIREIIDQKTNGNVLKFATEISKGLEDGAVSQQKLNRLFNLDTRTNKYPTVPQDIFEAILRRYPEIDAHWLITGQEKSGTQPDQGVSRSLSKAELAAIKESLDVLNSIFQSLPGSAPSRSGVAVKVPLGRTSPQEIIDVQRQQKQKKKKGRSSE
jgi:hypothetical protein